MKVFRYEVPVDDEWHEVQLTGPIVHVAAHFGQVSPLHFWALSGVGEPHPARLRVFGTGHQVPDDAEYRGTAIIEPLVWHLFEELLPA
jgi:hypothetical protein